MKRLSLFLGMLLVWLVPASFAAADTKLDLKVLYVGTPGSGREKEFVDFLTPSVARVGTGDLAKFAPADAADYDVVILDTDADGFKTRGPQLPANYTKPTMTLSVMGGLMTGGMGLKTGYL